MLPDPNSLFLECQKNPEPLIDEAYCLDELIISKDVRCDPTEAVITHREVIERICAAKIARNEEKFKEYERHIKALDKILTEKEAVQFFELTSFFPAMDVSFSAYKRMVLPNRLAFLKILLEHYLNSRHDAYMSHGYSAVTIQARKDFGKHKRQGGFANRKIGGICEELGYTPVPQGKKIGEAGQLRYCFIDQKQGQISLRGLEEKGESWHRKWSESHGGKKADVLFSGKDQYFICEAKHIKESGGGQDKQLNELIAFIDNMDHSHANNNIFYVAFLDGAYFNKLFKPRLPVKIKDQKQRIERCLQNPRKNGFFVNTFGLKELLKSARGGA